MKKLPLILIQDSILRVFRRLFALTFSFALLCIVLLAGLALTGCAGKNGSAEVQKQDVSQSASKKGDATSQSENEEAKLSKYEAQRQALEERIIDAPMLITADYFRKTAGESKPLRLFGDSKKEKELEERLARLEERLRGLPERAKGPGGMPVLRRKVVLLSLLGDLGLDILARLPVALSRTNGLVPVDASQLSKLLEDHGYTVSDLASASVRKEVAWLAGIQAYVLVYFPQTAAIDMKPSSLRIDVIHATQSVLIGSYLSEINEFDKVAPKISEDVIRATEWWCRVVSVEQGVVYLSAGRLTGLQPGDRLKVYSRGKELIDPLTHRSLGYAPGKLKGMIEIKNLFGTDASQAAVVEGAGIKAGDIVKMDQLA